MKHKNIAKKIVETLKEAGTELTMMELTRRTSSHYTTVAKATKLLVGVGFIEEAGGNGSKQFRKHHYVFKRDFNKEEYNQYRKTQPKKQGTGKRKGEMEVKKLSSVEVQKCPHCKKMIAIVRV